tara:strand:- start:108 stop:905 length:798 start_codon:yes stop_codon:yes gene_type:complete
MIEKIEDPEKMLKFSMYNLDPDDPCSIESIVEAIGQLIEQFFVELEESFEEIAESAGGAIIAILIIVIADYIAAQLDNLIQEFGLDTLFGNALKALMNALATILCAINGAKIYMQYLAVKALYAEVQLRLEMSKHLQIEFNYLVQVLLHMQNLDFGKNDSFAEIYESMGWIRKAKLGVGLELGKALNNKQPSVPNLVQSEGYIQKAIDSLTPEDELSAFDSILSINDLLDDYGIGTDLALFTDTELSNLAQDVRQRFFTLPDPSQ